MLLAKMMGVVVFIEAGRCDGDDEAVLVAGAQWWTISGVRAANKVAQA